MIFITGCARSGTSLTTKILQAHGLYLGSVNILYEQLDIRENVLKPYLRAIGADPRGQAKLPDTDNLPAYIGLREAVLKRLPDKAGYKDAKLTLVWPVWAKAFPDAKWVLVRRDADDIVDSCIRTPFMKAYGNDRVRWRAWVAEHEKRFERMRTELDLIEVWPKDFIANSEAFNHVTNHCGLAFKADVVQTTINPGQFLSA